MRNSSLRTSIIGLSALLSIITFQANSSAEQCPCDIYAAGGTPCVAAHSTVRALYSTYNGPLFQVKRLSDGLTLDVGVLIPGGYANTAAVDSFCKGTKGYLNCIYDQTGKGNVLWVQGSTEVPASTSSKPVRLDTEAVYVAGNKIYPAFINPDNCFWHDGSQSGMPTGSQPEAMYMVTSGTHYNGCCCFDYGNSETDRSADGAGAMDAINFSNECWYGTATIPGPWVQADLEYGVFSGGSQTWNKNQVTMAYPYVTAILKNNGTTNFELRGTSAQSGSLVTVYNGALPSGWSPMKKQGALILGCGGDCCKPSGGANCSAGSMYEGAIVSGYPADSIDNQVQENIIAAGYGVTTGIWHGGRNMPSAYNVKLRYNQASASAVISYGLQDARRMSVNVFDQRGRRIATAADGSFPAGRHEAVWDTRQVPTGVYICRVAMDGAEGWSGEIVIEK